MTDQEHWVEVRTHDGLLHRRTGQLADEVLAALRSSPLGTGNEVSPIDGWALHRILPKDRFVVVERENCWHVFDQVRSPVIHARCTGYRCIQDDPDCPGW
jgi:hypothetical protein